MRQYPSLLLVLICSCILHNSYAQSNYRIGIYELLLRKTVYVSNIKPVQRYEIRNLFVKQGDRWVIDTEYKAHARFFLAQNDRAGTVIDGYRVSDTLRYLPQKTVYYAPVPVIKLGMAYDRNVPEEDPPCFLKSCLVTNNARLRQQTTWQPYIPAATDMDRVKQSFPAYIRQQFSVFGKGAALSDSLVGILYAPGGIVADSVHSLADGQGNKLVSFYVPVPPFYHDKYPFNPWCFREDMPRTGVKITCYIERSGRLLFLQDELQYLGHGDFDNDGKDEYLFWYSIFNHDGYVVFYDDFRQTSSLLWSYH